ncbi:MAG: hypothetical protein AB8G11_10300 [Saprospiraceae bacterium]
MKYLLFGVILFFFCNCQSESPTMAADEGNNIQLMNTFDFELVGEVSDDKMKTVTSINILKKTDGTFFQTLNGFQAIVQENEQVIIEDLNFDGYADIRLLQYLPEDANIPFFYWLYNPSSKSYERNEALEIVRSPSIDDTNELILSQWGDGDSIQGTDYYQYSGSKLVIIKQEVKENTDEESFVLTVKQPVGDSLKVIKQEVMKRDDIIN